MQLTQTKNELASVLPFLVLNSGKTAMAATIGIESDFPYVKIVSINIPFLSHHSIRLRILLLI